MVRLPFLGLLYLVLAGFAVTSASADAQQPRNFQVPQRIQTQEDVPTLTRRALDVQTEQDEDGEAEPADRRDPVSSYGLTCANIRRVMVYEEVIRLSCYDQDRFGNLNYALRVSSYDPSAPDDPARRWYASEFLAAIYHAMETPGASISLRVGEQRAYSPYIQDFTVEYED